MKATFEELASRLMQAYSGHPVESLRDGLARDDIEGAYKVQAIVTERWRAAGRQLVGRKIGLTSRAIQERFGISEPDYGALFADMEVPDKGFLDVSRTIIPLAEGEVAFVLASDLDKGPVGPQEVAAATAHICAAIEIVDSRFVSWADCIADTVADNSASAFFVLGSEKRLLDEVDLTKCGMSLEINGEVRSTGSGLACMGSPLNSVVWLANTMLEAGQPLRAGDVILSGSLGLIVRMTSGDRIKCIIDGLGEASFEYCGANSMLR